jgi:hypothetical protein
MRFPFYAALACVPLTATSHKIIKFADGTKPHAKAGYAFNMRTRRGSVATYDEALYHAGFNSAYIAAAASFNALRMERLLRDNGQTGEVKDTRLRKVRRKRKLPDRDIRLKNTGLRKGFREEEYEVTKPPGRHMNMVRLDGYAFQPVETQPKRMSTEVKVSN